MRPANRDEDARARLWRVEICNLRLDGDPEHVDARSSQPRGGDGLRCEAVNEVYLHGLWVDHHGGHGINLIDCYEDPRVVDCIITYNAAAGIHILRGHDIVVNANQLEENLDACSASTASTCA